MRREVTQPRNWLKYVEIFATFSLVTSFTRVAEITWGLHNLSRGWQHKKFRSHFHPAVPCCTENEGARPFHMASSKAFKRLLVVSPQNFPSIIR
jgi:hypothetical protein